MDIIASLVSSAVVPPQVSDSAPSSVQGVADESFSRILSQVSEVTEAATGTESVTAQVAVPVQTPVPVQVSAQVQAATQVAAQASTQIQPQTQAQPQPQSQLPVEAQVMASSVSTTRNVVAQPLLTATPSTRAEQATANVTTAVSPASSIPETGEADFSASMPVAPAASSPTTERVALDAVVELPKPMASANPVTLPGQAAADVTEDSADTLTHDSLDLFPVSGMFAPSTDEQVPDSSSDSSLDDIRQRMALIESAGQLDNASVVVVPTAPVQVIVTASATTGDSTGSASLLADSAALQTANASFDIDADFGKAIDLDADTDSNSALPTAQPAATALAFQVDSQGAAQVVTENAMQPLTGAFATVLQDLRMQTDDTLVDSQPNGSNAVSGAASVTADAQSGFTMAALGLGTTGLIRASQTVGNDLELSPAIGTTAWQDGLGQQVIDMFKRGDKQVDLRLNPSELGPLSISLNLNDGNTQAQFQSAHASVRSAVEQALPQLRDALASQGITLGQTSVGDDPSSSSGQPRRDAQSDGGFTPSNRGVEPVPQVNELPTQTLLVGGLGVDLYI